MPLNFDNNEPEKILKLLEPVADVEVGAFNKNGYADYHWYLPDGTLKNVERKTWGELLTNPDKVEEQLLRHLNNYPDSETVFLFEGQAVQNDGNISVLKETKRGFFIKGYKYNFRSLSGMYAWLYSISKYVEIISTTTQVESAYALAGMYNYDMKEKHATFTRHIKKTDFNPNPQVVQLMGVSPGMGDVRASSLINHCGTVWNTLSAGLKCDHCMEPFNNITIDELVLLENIGKRTLEKLYRSVGRTDV